MGQDAGVDHRSQIICIGNKQDLPPLFKQLIEKPQLENAGIKIAMTGRVPGALAKLLFGQRLK